MNNALDSVFETIDGMLAWLGSALGQLNENYCLLETADDRHTLAAKDGSLLSIIRVNGATFLVGDEEFDRIHHGVTQSLQTALSQPGHGVQVFFLHDRTTVKKELQNILQPAKQTANHLGLSLDDLFEEKINHLASYCASEEMYLALWTRPSNMTKTQLEQANKDKIKRSKEAKTPPIRNAQNILAPLSELRNSHDSFVKMTLADFNSIGLYSVLLDVHDSCTQIRRTVDPDYTSNQWRPCLPGDKIPFRETKNFKGSISDILWPPLYKQLIPRDGENLDLRTTRIGDRIYSNVFIDIFPKDIAPFATLFRRMLEIKVPWRISFMLESNGLDNLGLKPVLASFLSFASGQNKLINKSIDYLNRLKSETDDALVKIRVTATTWAKVGEESTLRTRAAELAKSLQGWGYCETSEVSGDSYGATLSTTLGLSDSSHAIASVAPLSDATYLLPINRPASPWSHGAVLFRSPDGKPWPYQPGSSLQTTWIDLIYARPGSGKSVLSNSMNLALCLSAGIQRLPRIAIIDIGPSSSGLISLLKESLPKEKRHLVAYHRLRMVKEMSINPFDTQLGCRKPTAQERAFLVNFLSLLATPVGETKAYDGIADMAGLIIDELYKNLSDGQNPNLYTANLDTDIDKVVEKLSIKIDSHTTWWEITDELFKNGDVHMATIAQRYAMPLLADCAAICRTQTIEDLYGSITTPTGETLINAFGRMISSAVREYPILSRVTSFDLGEARIVSLDLDEVAKSGGDAADRQTAIMYMLGRYVLARHYYLTEDILQEIPEIYKEHHKKRILEIREDLKRIVFDEFHRTSKAAAVREQVLVDMREGRKWKVQVSLLSQSLEDFDKVMVEFATAIFIMDAGPKQAIEKSCKVFGLSETAKTALATRVHGPKLGGATFLAQFATKAGNNTQLITSTIGPIELWAFNTTAEDTRIRNALYEKIGAAATRRILAMLYPTGTATKVIEQRLNEAKEDNALITDEVTSNIIDTIIKEIIDAYRKQE